MNTKNETKKNKKKKCKLYFRVLKKIMKVKYKEPTFIYLGDALR